MKNKVNQKLEELRLDIGDNLFSLLSDEDKQFIIGTEGIIDLGRKFTKKDFKRIEKSLRELKVLCRRCNQYKGHRLDFKDPRTKVLLLKYLERV